MAKRSKGLFGAIGGLWRLTITGLAIVLLFAIYLNTTDQPGQEIAAVEPVEPPVVPDDDANAEPVVAEEKAEEPLAPETVSSETAEAIEEEVTEVVAEAEAAVADVFSGVITVPGDDASYELLNAFRRDDGAIEITTTRSFEGTATQTTSLVTCAPLALGTISDGNGERNDAPEMERISLGTASASLAAAACGALR